MIAQKDKINIYKSLFRVSENQIKIKRTVYLNALEKKMKENKSAEMDKHKDKLAEFVNSEETFNLIAHQRRYCEELRMDEIKTMRKRVRTNREIRSTFTSLNIDLDHFANKKKLSKINKAMICDTEKDKIENIGIEKLKEQVSFMTEAIEGIQKADEIEPIPVSIQEELLFKEQAKKEDQEIYRVKETGEQDGISDVHIDLDLTCDLKWRWVYNLSSPTREVRYSMLKDNMKKVERKKRMEYLNTKRVENQFKTVCPLYMFGDSWLDKQNIKQILKQRIEK